MIYLVLIAFAIVVCTLCVVVYASKGISINVVYNMPEPDPLKCVPENEFPKDTQYDEKGDLVNEDLEKTFTSMTQAMQDLMLDREDTNNGK